MADDVAREVKTAVQALDGLNIGCTDVVVSVEVKDGMLVVMGQGVVEGGSARPPAACSRPSRRRGQVRRRRRSHPRWSLHQHNVSKERRCVLCRCAFLAGHPPLQYLLSASSLLLITKRCRMSIDSMDVSYNARSSLDTGKRKLVRQKTCAHMNISAPRA